MSHPLFRAGLAGALCLAALPALAEFRTLDGTVAYRERIALPPGAIVQVQLVDISRADAPSVMLGAVSVRPSGQVPVSWQVSYDDAMVSATGRYAVQAEITLADRTLFHTTEVFPALTMDAPDKVDVMVQMAQAPKVASLEGTAWIAEDLTGSTLVDGRLPELTFGPDGRVSGTGGCNRMSGSYDTTDDSVSFGPMAATQMACPEPIGAQEQAFHKALGQVQSFAIEDRMLMLIGADGAVLMRLKMMF